MSVSYDSLWKKASEDGLHENILHNLITLDLAEKGLVEISGWEGGRLFSQNTKRGKEEVTKRALAMLEELRK